MASQLKPSFRDMLALSSTCRSMYMISIPLRYRYVSINSFASSTAAENFAGLLLQRPDIAQFVKVLKIIGDNYVDKGHRWRISTEEEECLRYILNHDGYKNLKTVALALPTKWALLPRAIKDACTSVLQYPKLQNVKLYIEAFPRRIFGLLPPELSHLELRGTVYSEYSFEDEPEDQDRNIGSLTICRPRKLEIWDPYFQLDRGARLFTPDSHLQLSATTWLKVIVAGIRLSPLESTISGCSRTLTHLEIHHTWGPKTLRLGHLPRLETLILSADLSTVTMDYAGTASVGPRNFTWLIHALQSLSTSNTLRSITFLLLVVSFDAIQSSNMRWHDLDSVFHPSTHHKWPNLETFLIHVVNGDEHETVASFNAVQSYAFLSKHVPTLCEAQVLKMQASCTMLEIWSDRSEPKWDLSQEYV
ncbi:hypothetical protein CVT24_006316 [Panaeolus cyanescens]|uniref:F-box domain-containing protein n=1 Tax=Panaeolus cyanescens TaxID=181874 RepID=A0A409YEB7_9AGAR|nr:hypothetical protein CVT24_006316 [Panaeolus cyanescens]